MKLNYSFELVEMGDEIIAVPVGENASQLSGIVKLNDSAKEIFELLKSETTECEIVDILVAKYEDDPTTIARYVHNTIETLRENKLIID